MRRYEIFKSDVLPEYPWVFQSYDGSDAGSTATHAEAIAAVYSEDYWSNA